MWTTNVEPSVFARLKTYGEVLKTNFPDIVFTTENESDTIAKFPTVLLEELGGAEQGRDLDGSTINAYLSTFQITIAHNDKKYHVRNIMDNCMDTMKKLRFEMVGSPTFNRNQGVWMGVARFRRTIGANDTL